MSSKIDTFLASSPDAILVFSAGGRLIGASAAAQREVKTSQLIIGQSTLGDFLRDGGDILNRVLDGEPTVPLDVTCRLSACTSARRAEIWRLDGGNAPAVALRLTITPPPATAPCLGETGAAASHFAQCNSCLLPDLSRLMTSAPGPEEALDEGMQLVARLYGWDFGALWRCDDADGSGSLADGFHGGAGCIRLHDRLAELGSWATLGIQADGPLWLRLDADAAEAAGPLGRLGQAAGYRTGFVLPLMHEEILLAVFVFFAEDDRPCDPALMQFSAVIAAQIAAGMRAKYIQRALATEEARSRAIVNSIPAPVLITRRDDAVVLYRNDQCDQLIGQDLPVGRDYRETVTYADPEDPSRLISMLDARGRTDAHKLDFKLADGRDLELEVTSSEIMYEGEPAYCTVAIDVSDVRTLERRLIRRNAELHRTQAKARIGAWEWHRGEEAARVSPETLRLLGLEERPPEVDVRTLLNQIAPADRERTLDALRLLYGWGRPVAIEIESLDQPARILHFSAEPRFEGSEVVSVFGFVQDITELAATRRDLENERRFLQVLLDNLEEGIVACDGEGHLRLLNRAARKLHGVDADADLAQTDWSTVYGLLDPATGDALETADVPLVKALRGETVRMQALLVRHPDGEIRHLLTNAQPIRSDTGEQLGAVATMRDMTERYDAEKAVEERRSEFGRIFNAARDGKILIDFDSVVQEANSAACAQHGCTRDEMIGLSCQNLFDDDSGDVCTKALAEVSAGQTLFLERSGRRMDGCSFPAEVNAAPIRLGGRDLALVTVRDISERKSLERQLVQAQRMEAVGQLTGGVAHDFNNLLQALTMNLEVLEEQLSEQNPVREAVGASLEIVERGSQLTQHMLAFARKQTLEPELRDVNELVEDLLPLIRQSLGDAIEVKTQLISEALRVHVDPVQFESMLINLALNARDAMPNGGRLDITTAEVEFDTGDLAAAEFEAREHMGLTPGRYVVLTACDTGTGMPAHVEDRIFEPFFSTKEVGRGSGLGLSMVFGFVRQSRGYINVYSEEGHGTAFKVYLPMAEKKEEATIMAMDAKQNQLPRGEERILVVDDDSIVRDSVSLRLISLGYAVETASNGPEALDVLGGNAQIDLVFSDVVMPGGMSGEELAEEVHRRQPAVKILLTSGFPGGPERDGKANVPTLAKPYRTRELAEVLRGILRDRD